MDRRAFLTLIAAAPIAALAPLPKLLEQRRLMFHPKAFEFVMAPLTIEEERRFIDAIRFDLASRARFNTNTDLVGFD
jgi:hypothetical protein